MKPPSNVHFFLCLEHERNLLLITLFSAAVINEWPKIGRKIKFVLIARLDGAATTGGMLADPIFTVDSAYL